MTFVTFRELKVAILSGLCAEIVFEAYAWLISPSLFGLSLQPAKLVMALTQQFSGITLPYQLAFAIHAMIGTVGFGLFVLLFHKLIPRRAAVPGIVAGVILWFIAQGFLAPLIGREFMMKFGPYTQSSFVGHVGMALVISLLLHWRLNSTKPVYRPATRKVSQNPT